MSTFDPHGTPGTSVARSATAREFLAVVFRRKWIVLGLFLVTTVTALAVSFSQKLVFISGGQVLVKRGEPESSLTPTKRIMGQWEEELGSEVQVAKSYPVIELAREVLKAEVAAGKSAIEIDPRAVDAEVVGKTSVLAIGYTDANPEVAQRVCNALLTAYIRFRQTDLSMRYPREFFERELGQVRTELERVQARRRDYALRQNLVDVQEESRGMIARLNSLLQTRSEVAADLAEAQEVHRRQREMDADSEMDLPTFSQAYSNEVALVEMKRKVIDGETRLALLRERFREETPEVQAALQSLGTMREMLRKEVEARLKLSASKVTTMEARVAIYDRDIAQLTAQLEGMPIKAAEVEEMDRQIKLYRERIEELVKKSDQALVNEQTSANVTAILLEPAAPSRPANPRDPVRIALAPAFSLVVGIGLAFFIDGLDLTVRTVDHAEDAARIPVLAAVTERRRRSRP